MLIPLLSRLTHAHIVKNTSQVYFSRGKDYFRRGLVLSTEITDANEDNVSLKGVVRGTQTYQQQINIRFLNGDLYIAGHCDCPIRYNCKHIAAVCLQVCESSNERVKAEDSQTWQNWIDDLSQACSSVTRSLLEVKEFIVYHLRPEASHPNKLVVEFFVSRVLKNGRMGKKRRLSASRMYDTYNSLSYVQDIDLEIVKLLSAGNDFYRERPLIYGSTGYLALAKLLESGRCFWMDTNIYPLQLAEPREILAEWQSQKSGQVQLEVKVVPQGQILFTDPPCYIDPEGNCCGVIENLPYSLEQLKKLLDAPQIPVSAIDTFSRRLAEKIKPEILQPPKPVSVETIEGVKPTPYLYLAGEDKDEYHFHIMRMQFIYGDHVLPYSETDSEQVVHQNGRIIRICRDGLAEKKAVEEIVDLGFSPRFDFQTGSLVFLSIDEHSISENAARWFYFVNDSISELEKQGWRIEYDPSFTLEFHEITSWQAEIEEQSNDWFNLHFEIEVNGQPMALLPLVTQIFDHYEPEQLPEKLIFSLGDSQYLNISSNQLAPIINTLYELYDSDSLQTDGSLKLSRFDAPRLTDLDEQGDNLKWRGGEALRKLGKQLKDFTGIAEHRPPEGLKAILRPYQQHGLNWLQFLREYGFAGILADDMGLGKTIQTIAHILLEKQQGRLKAPCLIIAPTSLMHNWRREIEYFSPTLSCLILQGVGRHENFSMIASHDIILSTYPLIVRDEEMLLAHNYYMLVLDEAQVVKNPKAKAAQLMRKINTIHRLCLTGTPMENHLGELWALFDFLMPGFLGTSRQFNNLFRIPIEKQDKTGQRERLANRVAPFMLRRAKADVATELPEKTEIIHRISLGKKQATLYESIRVAMEQKVKQAIADKGLARSHITILDALLKLRQTCCDPRLLKLSQARTVNESAKLELLMQLLPEMIEEGRRILLFSQFTTMLGHIETELQKHKISFSKLTGQTRHRSQAIDLFKSGDVSVFLISLKAGGVGLNLTEADTVIHYDPWWNPAAENQATDRAHRIGQDKAVFVYKFVVENSVEEKILDMQAKKAALAQAVYKNTSQSEEVAFDKDDLQQLFAPLEL